MDIGRRCMRTPAFSMVPLKTLSGSECGKRPWSRRQTGENMSQVQSSSAAITREDAPPFIEHFVPVPQGRVYAREYNGTGPAFVLMHGFPDNLRIYDDLIPYLVAGGRRVISFDFLGYGASEKPNGASYSFEQQFDDLKAVIEQLGSGKVVLVPHDSYGIAAINFAVEYPEKVAAMRILNSAYDDTPLNVWPEMIVLFAEPSLTALAGALAQSPEQFR
jgi:haloalkane dehalogenase